MTSGTIDGVNEMILADSRSAAKTRKLLVHFDRNGLGYTLDRDTGELLVAEKYDPAVNWTTGVDMDKNSPTYGRPKVRGAVSTDQNGEDVNTQGHLPGGARHQGPAARGLLAEDRPVLRADQPRLHGLRAVPGELHRGPALCRRDALHVSGAGQPRHMGNFIAWDARRARSSGPSTEQFSVWSGALATAGGVVFYGTLEGYLKAVDAKTGKELYKFKTPSGIIGNVMTYEQGGKQYVAILSGVGGWAGIGLAAGLTDPTAGLGAVGGYAGAAATTRRSADS